MLSDDDIELQEFLDEGESHSGPRCSDWKRSSLLAALRVHYNLAMNHPQIPIVQQIDTNGWTKSLFSLLAVLMIMGSCTLLPGDQLDAMIENRLRSMHTPGLQATVV